MGLWGYQEGEVVATVCQRGREVAQSPVHPGSGQVCPNQSRSQGVAAQVDSCLLHGMTVEGGHGARCGPVVVHLMDVLEEERMMEESEGE